jgi:hypothetical protein
MKILYLILGTATQGVKNKILDKTSFIRQAGAEVTVLLITGSHEAVETGKNIEVLTVDHTSIQKLGRLIFLWRFSILFEHKKTFTALSGYLTG